MKQISGNKLLVKALKEEGVDVLFGYPGACTIDISDELYKQSGIDIILPRHEQALVHEADAYARTTGKVGVCLVTSGPGATNLVTGLATANYDSVPLVCFTGQVARHLIGNDAFQEVDIVGITRSITKYGVTVRNREDLGRIIKEAFYIARTGRPGPVLIDLPKDVMAELGSAEYPKTVNIRGYKPNTSVHIGQLKRALKMLQKAKKPLFLAGGGVIISRAQEIFTQVVEKTQIPVVTTVMGRGAISTKNPLFIGNLGMHGAYAANMAVNECDLLFSIGTRFNDRITGKLHEFAPHAQIVHIDIDTASISRNIHVDIRDCRNGVNHLVCAGEGENQQRAVVHLYVQEDGSIGETQRYFGQDEKAEAYIYTSADATQLKEDGTKRLKDLMNYKKCEMTVEGVDLELGDIVSGYDEITDTQVKKPVIRKILKVQDGNVSIDYKLEGEN